MSRDNKERGDKPEILVGFRARPVGSGWVSNPAHRFGFQVTRNALTGTGFGFRLPRFGSILAFLFPCSDPIGHIWEQNLNIWSSLTSLRCVRVAMSKRLHFFFISTHFFELSLRLLIFFAFSGWNVLSGQWCSILTSVVRIGIRLETVCSRWD